MTTTTEPTPAELAWPAAGGEAGEAAVPVGASGPPAAEASRWDHRGYLGIRRLRDLLTAPLVIPLARLGVAPWVVSLAGVVLAAATWWTLPRHAGLTLALFLGALVCDAVDGALARRLGCAGPRGKLLDLVCDSATLTALLLALLATGLVSPVRGAYAAYVTLLLLFLAVCHHSARAGDGPGAVRPAGPLRPRGGFYAHLPKAPVYAALLLWLLGGPRWLDPAVLTANLLATLFAAAYLIPLLKTPGPRSPDAPLPKSPHPPLD